MAIASTLSTPSSLNLALCGKSSINSIFSFVNYSIEEAVVVVIVVEVVSVVVSQV